MCDETAANHHGDELILGDGREVHRTHLAAVAQHRRPCRNAKDFFEFMRDVNHRDIAGLQGLDHADQPFELARGEAGRGFVHCDHAGLAQKRLCDFDNLSLRDAQFAQWRSNVDRGTKRRKKRAFR